MELVEEKKETIELNKKSDKKRDYMVDVIRIIACAIVVLVHTNDLGIKFVDKGRIFWGVALGDGVAIFFMVTGFFIFNNNSYIKLWQKTFKNIILPSLATLIFSELFFDVISNKITFSEWLHTFSFNFGGFINNIISFNAPESCPHLWYIYTYIKIIVFFPILKCIADNKKVLKYVIYITVGVLIYNDLCVFFEPNCKLNTFYFFEIPMAYTLIGYMLYSYKDKVKGNKKFTLYGILIFVCIECLRYFMQYKLFESGIWKSRFIYWDSCFACICVSLFILIILSLDIKKESIGEKVSFIGQRTFVIYLIHPLVIAFLGGINFRNWVLNMLGYTEDTMVNMTFGSEVIYIFSRFIVEFIISLIFAILFYEIKKSYIYLKNKKCKV